MATNKHLFTAAAYATLIEELVDGHNTVFDLAAATGLALNTVRKVVRVLVQRKRLHISGWETDNFGRHTIAVYGWGYKPPAARPRALSSTERSRHRYVRQRRERMLLSTG